jgi:hypothetical protein
MTELSTGTSEHESRVVTQWLGEDGVILGFRLLKLAKFYALLGERLAVGDGVGDFDLILEGAVGLFGIECPADTPARVLALVAAEPFRDQFDDHIGDRAAIGIIRMI